jgi:hypothetical protein
VRVARVFHRLLAAIFLIAWISLATQVELLIGSHGLLPLRELVAHPPGDGLIVAGAWFGAALGLLGVVGPFPRPLLAVQVPLYLAYTVACRSFLGFQWDNLLLECGLLGLFLPRDRPARLAHLAFRLLLFKLYFESGIAKWQSHLHDWHDGSAMTYYYETAPLPTALAFYAHHLPAWWHHLESRAVLVLELVVPFLVFGPRRARLVAFVLLTGFQLVNIATANYGFFCYLALALHVFLLDDSAPAPRGPRWRAVTGGVLLGVYVLVSTIEGLAAFAGVTKLDDLRAIYAPLRLVNTYHLFGHITRERIEPEFQTSEDGVTFVAHDLHFKPGDPARAPRFVAPHQPRVDFLLWFYGLAAGRRPPEYVVRLLGGLCHDPDAVAPLFRAPLPRAPTAVQIVFWDYHFAAPGADAWWTRTERRRLGPFACADVPTLRSPP